MLRSEVMFTSGFPDHGVYSDDEDIQPGHNIAETLKAALEELGYRVSDPINGGDHGWELEIWRGRKRIWLQISAIGADENYLIAERQWLWPDMKPFAAFLWDLQRILQADSRFSQIGWFPKGGTYGGATPAPGPSDV